MLPKFSSFINEGGNAIKSSSRINQENVASTLKSIQEKLLPRFKLKPSDTAMLGSTGKKLPGGSSGDIDLALSIQALIENNNLETTKDIFDFIVKESATLTHEIKDMRQMGLVSIAWPISNDDGKQDGLFVQLDLMVVDSIDWATWAYYSPAEWESPWKGLYRNELLYAIAKFMDYKVLKTAMNKEGVTVDAEWERNFFDLGKGLLKGTQSAMGKTGITKTVKTIDKVILNNNPDDTVKMMFGPNFTSHTNLTWEDTFKNIMSPDFIYKNKLKEILKMAKDGIISKGYPVPEELDKLV
jgi:hypothetical protein